MEFSPSSNCLDGHLCVFLSFPFISVQLTRDILAVLILSLFSAKDSSPSFPTLGALVPSVDISSLS